MLSFVQALRRTGVVRTNSRLLYGRSTTDRVRSRTIEKPYLVRYLVRSRLIRGEASGLPCLSSKRQPASGMAGSLGRN
ncbi:MAG: hypothetical protein MUE44_29495 [Oscillatoriaceae cyanobacterium Prado104]|nr:hypothetical protein [Oscillatoriaceae cyanobacterium Prado104]